MERLAGMTMGAVFGKENDTIHHRSLLDVFRQEQPNAMARGAERESNQRPALAQLLRVRLGHVAEQAPEDDESGEVPWAVTAEVQPLNQNHHSPQNSLHINSLNSMLHREMSHIPRSDEHAYARSQSLFDALAAEREHMQMVISSTEDVTETNNHDDEQDEQQQVGMPLMDLMEESRRLRWSSYTGEVEDYTDEGNEYAEEEEEEEEGSNLVEQNCSVCNVRHKGSAFIPCGHSFCRMCSRKLRVIRGNCPVCNGFIQEILDIF